MHSRTSTFTFALRQLWQSAILWIEIRWTEYFRSDSTSISLGIVPQSKILMQSRYRHQSGFEGDIPVRDFLLIAAAMLRFRAFARVSSVQSRSTSPGLLILYVLLLHFLGSVSPKLNQMIQAHADEGGLIVYLALRRGDRRSAYLYVSQFTVMLAIMPNSTLTSMYQAR